MATLEDVRPVLTVKLFGIEAREEKPEHGRGTCIWTAHDPGLIASASPSARLIVDAFRSSDPAWTAKTFAADFAKALVPGQVRTSDAGDRVARPSSTTVAVRHDATVVVVNASGQDDTLENAPDRFYKLEAFALRLAGAAVQGPSDPRTVVNPCATLDEQHVLGILTHEPSSLKISSNRLRCTLRVEDGSGINGHWVANRGEVEIRRQDLGTNAEALTYQHGQTPLYPVSSLVRTTDATDRLLTSSDHPEEVWAVHGGFYVALQVKNETAAARDMPGWLYRVQRLAFEAAGATVVPSPEIPPDPAVPKPIKLATPEGLAVSWTPPPHAAPDLAWLSDPVVAAFAFLVGYRFFLLPVSIVIPILLGVISSSRSKQSGKRRRGLGAWPALLIPFSLVTMFFGTRLSTALIVHSGEAGSATVTASRATAVTYNNHRVHAYSVLIRTAAGPIVESSFADDDFNVYPSANGTIYPGVGDVFTVRYLKHAPRTFAIIANDGSPWAHRMRCFALERTSGEAAAKLHFAPDNPDYKAADRQAAEAASAAGCHDGE